MGCHRRDGWVRFLPLAVVRAFTWLCRCWVRAGPAISLPEVGSIPTAGDGHDVRLVVRPAALPPVAALSSFAELLTVPGVRKERGSPPERGVAELLAPGHLTITLGLHCRPWSSMPDGSAGSSGQALRS